MPKPLKWNTDMDIHPIHTDADYKAALREVSAYFDSEPEPGTPDGDRFEVLLTLVEAYEAKHFPVDLPDPVEAIKFRMEQAGLTPKDLVPVIGRLNRVYEILNRKRPLTLNMIWRLHDKFGIPAESLIQPSKLTCCFVPGSAAARIHAASGR
jgi:HTH-type transcriptional regulator/antitoxin HigA